MDQVKIGEFIAAQRKDKQFTQQQLADELGISNKTVSKWETGKGMPEISFLLPLCEALEISVNELLSAEKLSESEYRKKAEENMMDLMREREENKKNYQLTTIIGIIATVSFMSLMMVVAVYAEAISLPVKIMLSVIACAVFGVGVYIAGQGDRKIGYFKCAKCGKTFVPSMSQYMKGMHTLTTRHMECPHCHEKSWCKKVMAREE